MKKAIVLLLALAVLGGAVFADPALTFGSYGDVYMTLADQDTENSYGVYHEFYFNYKADDMGFSATVVNSDNDFLGAFRNYAVYYNMFDGMAKVYAGKLRETGDVRLTSYIDGNGFSTRIANVEAGILVKLMPVDGLVVDAFLPYNGAAVADDFALAAFGAGYTIADIGKLVASYRLANDELAIGFDVKAIEDTTLRLGYKMIVDGDMYVYLTAGKVIAGIDLGLDADVVIADEIAFGAEVKAEYGMDPYAIGLRASFDTGDAWEGNDSFYVKPYAVWNFSAGSITAGFEFNGSDSSWGIPVDFEWWY
jgi:hypothetical protein